MLIPNVTFGPTRIDDIDDDRVLDFANKISVLGPIIVSIEDLQNPTEQLKNKGLVQRVIEKTNANSLTPCYLEGLAIDQNVLAMELLDEGLHGVFFKQPAATDVVELALLAKVLSNFPRARVGVVLLVSPAMAAGPPQAMADYIEETIAASRAHAIHFFVQAPTASQQALDAIVATAKKLVEKSSSPMDNVHIYLGVPPAFYDSTKVAAKISTTMSDNTIHAVFRPKFFTDAAISPSPVSAAAPASSSSGQHAAPDAAGAEDGIDALSAYISCARSDRPDGLFTTVVCDEHGVALGLVYSNDVSIRAAVREKRGIYWSRSRGGLWRKGDSSGMYQELLAVVLDCDGDALRFTVVQHGTPPSFCHLMTRTCWGEVHGLQHLQSILQSRLVDAPVGSYTKRLFTDPELLHKKLLEEASELAEAGRVNPANTPAQNKDEVAGEAADLMYFLMVRCVAAGVTLRDIENKLDYRSLKVARRPGNAKQWRDEQAAAILGAGKPVAGALPPAPTPVTAMEAASPVAPVAAPATTSMVPVAPFVDAATKP